MLRTVFWAFALGIVTGLWVIPYAMPHLHWH
jgi:hypothetical protein